MHAIWYVLPAYAERDVLLRAVAASIGDAVHTCRLVASTAKMAASMRTMTT